MSGYIVRQCKCVEAVRGGDGADIVGTVKCVCNRSEQKVSGGGCGVGDDDDEMLAVAVDRRVGTEVMSHGLCCSGRPFL